MNTRQEKLESIKKEIIKNCEHNLISYYDTKIKEYININNYLNQLENNYDKISLSQWANNNSITDNLILNLDIPSDQFKHYELLLSKNIELNKTINLELLLPKYDFLSDMMDLITTDIDIQQQIVGLNDNELELFKRLYLKLSEITNYKVSLVEKILKTMGNTPFSTYKNIKKYNDLISDLCGLINNNQIITDENIEKILYLFTKTGDAFDIKDYNDLDDFNNTKNSKIIKNIDDIILSESKKENKNIFEIKEALLLRTFGIDFFDAKTICAQYDITNLEVTSENKEVIEMYLAIFQIYIETDADILIDIYNDFTKKMNKTFNCLRTIVFEKELTKAFSRELNKQAWSFNTPTMNIDGVDIYDSGLDFKMIVTAIGAYQNNFSDRDDYSIYWNNQQITTHANSCSLIANNNLSMAKIKNIVLGFNTMDDSMLLLSKEYDLNSTPAGRNFNISNEIYNKKFMSPVDMINNTRSDYNELVYERRDLSSNPKYFKKNPDYIVFIENYEDIDNVIETESDELEKEFLLQQKLKQEKNWNESIKAAKNFDIPIVKINREKCAKNELGKILKNLDTYKKTYNSNLLTTIITEFENNRIGNCNPYNYIRKKYFSKKIMNYILNEIYDTIFTITDFDIRMNNIEALEKIIDVEYKKFNKANGLRDNNQTISFSKKEVKNNLERLKGDLVNGKKI